MIDKDGLEAARRAYADKCVTKHAAVVYDVESLEAAILAYLSHMEAKRKPAEEVAREVVKQYHGSHNDPSRVLYSTLLESYIAAAIKADRGEKP